MLQNTFPYVHKGPKINTKLYMTCVQMFGNAKIWPYYMYNIKSWIFSYKVVKDFFITGSLYVFVSASYVKLAKAITVSNSTII